MSQSSKIVAIIIARLTSSRLPRKQLRLINDIPLIQHIIERLKPISRIDQIGLATGPALENQDLADISAKLGVDTYFDDDVDDVTGRIARAVKYFEADKVVTILGDCPLVDAHFLSRGIEILRKGNADYVFVDKTKYECLHEGLGFHTADTWQRLDKMSTTWSHKEHAGSVILEKSTHFHGIEIVPRPQFRRTDIRISVDTQADLDFMNQLYAKTGAVGTSLDLSDVVELVDQDRQILNINQHVHQKGRHEKSHHFLIITYASNTLGMGHLTRSLVLARELQETHSAKVTFMVNNDAVCTTRISTAGYSHQQWDNVTNLKDTLADYCNQGKVDGLVIDVKQEDLHGQFSFITDIDLPLTVIDVFPNETFEAALTIIPTLSTIEKPGIESKENLYIGSKFMLVNRDLPKISASLSGGDTILVTAGASGIIPEHLLVLLRKLPGFYPLRFIVGPYVQADILQQQIDRMGFERTEIVQNPQNIYQLFAESRFAFSVFGITSIELLTMGIPQCIYRTLSVGDAEIVKDLASIGACLNIAELSDFTSVNKVHNLLANDENLKAMSKQSQTIIDGKGGRRVAMLVANNSVSTLTIPQKVPLARLRKTSPWQAENAEAQSVDN